MWLSRLRNPGVRDVFVPSVHLPTISSESFMFRVRSRGRGAVSWNSERAQRDPYCRKDAHPPRPKNHTTGKRGAKGVSPRKSVRENTEIRGLTLFAPSRNWGTLTMPRLTAWASTSDCSCDLDCPDNSWPQDHTFLAGSLQRAMMDPAVFITRSFARPVYRRADRP